MPLSPPEPPRRRAALALLALSTAACGGGAGGAPGRSASAPTAPLAEAVAFEPAAATDAAGWTWTAWIRFDEATGAVALEATAWHGERTLAAVELARGPEWIAEARLAAVEGGAYAVWEEGALDGSARRLAGRALALDGERIAAAPTETVHDGPALFPRAVETRPGRLEVVYAHPDPDRGDLDLARRVRAGGRWSDPTPVRSTPADEWAPELATDSAGRLHVVFDAFEGERFRVVHAVLLDGELAREHGFPTAAGYQGFPTLARAPGSDAVWVAWEEAPQFGQLAGLRAERTLALAKVDGDDVRVVPPAALGVEGLRCDFPRVAATDAGLAVTFRGLGPPFPPGREVEDAAGPTPAVPRDRQYVDPAARFYTSFRTLALVFDEQGGASVLELPGTEGDNRASESLCAPSSGGALVAVLAHDGRDAVEPTPVRFEAAIESRWRVGRFALPATRGFPRTVRAAATPSELRSPALAAVDSVRLARAGERPVRYGDLHRHTDVSRCAGAYDGTLLDAWRYARGPGRLDFLAVTDHFQHLTPWSWWRNLRDAARFHQPGRLVVLAGVERAAPGRGHRNDVYREAGAIPYGPERWNAFPEEGGAAPEDAGARLSIPHMAGRRESPWRWSWLQPGVHALFEVYQGARGSYEGPSLPYAASDLDVPRAGVGPGLAAGNDFGLIAASDHGSSSAGLAGVHADELTRAAVFDALLARDCFAATDFARVEVRLGELRAGEAGPAAADAALAVHARGLAPVAAVEVVRNGARWRYLQGETGPELLVLTSRRWGPYPDRPLRVRATAPARIEAVRPRRRGEHEATIELEGGEVRFHKRREPLDLVLAVDGADLPGAALELALGEERARFPLADVPAGRSRTLPAPAAREELLRVGRSLDAADWSVELAPDALAPGDTFYVRVLFEDGNVAWSSPIRVTEVER